MKTKECQNPKCGKTFTLKHWTEALTRLFCSVECRKAAQQVHFNPYPL